MNKQIQDIINLVIKTERKNGLTDEQIKEKYICGGCKSLATLIKSQFLNDEKVKIIKFERSYVFFDPTLFDITFTHVCIATNLDKQGNLQPSSKIYDINGVREYKDIDSYLSNLLKTYNSHFKNKELYNRTPIENITTFEIYNDQHLSSKSSTCDAIQQCYETLNLNKELQI